MNTIGQAKVIVFCKQPAPTMGKTRMVPPLSAAQAAILSEAFLRETIQLVENIKVAQKILCFYPPKSQDHLSVLVCQSWTLQAQKGKDFGQRLENALNNNLKSACPVLLIGSDSPSLPMDFLFSALDALKNYDMVIGPALDGGFYLIGIKNFYSHLFDRVRWSSKRTFSDTLANSKKLGIRSFVLPKWYDIDHIHDLDLLISHLQCLPPEELNIIRKAIKNIFLQKGDQAWMLPKNLQI